jgi:hypothetical protein
VIVLNSTDIHRWKLASQAFTTIPGLLEAKSFKERASSGPISLLEWRFKYLLSDEAGNRPRDFLLGTHTTIHRVRVSGSLLNGLNIFFLVFTAIYGGLHAAAWNAYFPSIIERTMWRCSSIAIAVSGWVYALLIMLGDLSDYLYNNRLGNLYWSIGFPVSVLGVAFVATSVFSRVFLITEAFISLRRLPVAAYDTPHWLQNFPHL